MSKRAMLIHECQDDASDMFYCYAVGGGNDPEAKDLVDWYVREDDSGVLGRGEVNTISAITYCPFCGTKLPDKEQDAVGDTYRMVQFEEEDGGQDEEDGGQDRRRAGGNLPIYIVRWTNPEPSICLVQARNKSDVLAMMDEIGDPSYCHVQEYRGPLVISLDLRLKWHQAPGEGRRTDSMPLGLVPHTVVDDVSACINDLGFEWGARDAFAAMEMRQEVLRIAFPHYLAYMESDFSTDEEAEAECKKAIQQDFDDIEQEFRDKFAQEGE